MLSVRSSVLALGVFFLGPVLAQPTVTIALSPTGLSSLKYNGTEFLGYGDFYVNDIELLGSSGTFPANLTPTSVSMDAVHQELTRTYDWGSVKVRYVAVNNRLNLTITTSNTSPNTIQGIFYEALNLRFPAKPQEFDGFTPLLAFNSGYPSLFTMSYGSGVMALANDDVITPLTIGFPFANDPPNNTFFPLKIHTTRANYEPTFFPYIDRPIAPGASDQYTLSLRFGPPGSTAASLGSDIYQNYAAAYPSQLTWADRRPIGRIVLATPGAGYPTNPRGWFIDPSIDVTTPAGIANFQARLLTLADNSVAVLKSINAQGMVTWDIEGEQYPLALSYIGDPRIFATLAPEMAGVVDAYFQKFRDAGLRVGVAIRPQQVTINPDGSGGTQQDVPDPTQLLIDKINFAKNRWGVTLFYIDSNGGPNDPMDVKFVKQVAALFPDVLLIPEHENLRYYAYSAPYTELKGGNASSPPVVRLVYPNGLSIVSVDDGPIAARYNDLVDAVKQGDILSARVWFNSTETDSVRSIYQVAGGVTSTPPAVSITSPGSGATLSGSVTVSANASSSAGILGVQFSLDSAPLGSEVQSAPYSVNLNTALYANTTHSLTATARDSTGLTAAASVSFSINNPASGGTGVYYVSPSGNDSNNGLSPATPWRTVAKVNASLFSPGDQILFARGGEWHESLAASSDGTAGNPITYASYGSGPKPKFWGSDNLVNANFQPVGGNVFRYAVSVPVGSVLANHSQWFVDPKGQPVSAVPNSFTWDGTQLLINTAGSDPRTDGRTYSICVRDDIIYSNYHNHLVFRDLVGDESANNNEGYVVRVMGSADVLLENLEAYHGGRHLIGAINSTGFIGRGLYAAYAMPQSDTTFYVSYSDASQGRSGDTSQYINCTADHLENPGFRNYQIFYDHGSGLGSVYIQNMVSHGGMLSVGQDTPSTAITIKGGLIENAPLEVFASNVLVDGITITGQNGIIDNYGSNNIYQNVKLLNINPQNSGPTGFNSAIAMRGGAIGNTIRFSTIVLDPAAAGSVSCITLNGKGMMTKWYGNIMMCNNRVIVNWAGSIDTSDASQVDYNFYNSNATFNDIPFTQYQPGIDPHSASGDPKFVNPAGGDYSLQAISPAVDAAKLGPALLSQIPVDAAGNSRLQGTAFDMGALESGFSALPTFAVTVSSVPAGLSLTVDSSPCTSPCSFQWTQGSTHTLAGAQQAGGAGIQYVFGSWSDAGSPSHSITMGSAAASFTANFTTQYFLTTSAGAGGTINPPSGWYNSGAVVSVSAAANSGKQFTGFSGALNGTTTPQNVTMSAPATVSASFTAIPTFAVTVSSVPAGLSLTVDSSACTSPCSFQWTQGSAHTLAAAQQAGGAGIQYVFGSWSDAGSPSHSITMGSAAASFTANFTTQYSLTTSASGGGTINPPSGWYNGGAVVAVSAAANSGNQFTGFSGALSGTTTPQNVTMSAPVTVSANFSPIAAGSTGYLYSRTITVASGQVSGNQSNFPVLLKLTSAGSGVISDFATAGNGGKIQNSTLVNSRTVPADLIFTSDPAGLNLLNWEIESYNPVTGDLVVWVQVPSLSSAQNTSFYLYYDNGSVNSWKGNTAGTWDNNYVAVWHLADNAANATVLDSTTRGNHLVNQANTASRGAAGAISGALTFNGFSDYSKVAASPQSGLAITGNITLQSWVNFNSLPSQGSNVTILGKGQTDQTGAYSLSVINPAFVQTLQMGSSSFPNFYGTSYSLSSFTGAWHHIVGTWDGSAWRLYVDGSNVATTANAQGPVFNGEPFVIGGRDSNGGISNLMNGALDEVRVSNSARTASWITTEFHNQSTPAQFYSVGSVTTLGSGNPGLPVTVSSVPAGLSLTVDSSVCTSPCSFQWTQGSTHTLAAAQQAGGTGIQYVFGSWSDAGSPSHSITMGSAAASFTANFTTQYFLTTTAGTGGAINPPSGWYNSGAVVSVSAAANSGNQFTGFSGALNGTTTPQNVTMNAPASVSASFSPTAPTFAVTVSSVPAGLSLTVDSSPCTSPCSFQWTQGSTHTLAAAQQAGGAGIQYVFGSWSDAGSPSHSITMGSAAASFTANFTTQYFLTTSAGSGGTINPPSGWYNAGAVVAVSAAANSGNQFTGFSGALNGTTTPQNVTMSAPATVSASFTPTAPTFAVTVSSVPGGLSLTVDSSPCTSPCSFQWTQGSTHTLAAAQQAGGTGIQYVFANWSDAGSVSHSITMGSAAASYTANFTTQYFLTTSAGAGGTINPPSGWYNSGSVVAVSAAANGGNQFTGFSGALNGTTTPQNVTMSAPATVSASFSPIASGSTGYLYSRTITVASGQVSGNQSNFPVLLKLTSTGSGVISDFATAGNGGKIQNSTLVNSRTVPADLIFTSDSAGLSLLNWDIESYNPVTGDLVVWVQVPSLSSAQNTTFYLYYDNASVNSWQGNTAGTWDNNYVAVWHLADNAANATVLDSTTKGNHLVNQSNTASRGVAGAVSGALTFNGFSDYAKVAATPQSGLAITGNITLQSWVNFNSLPNQGSNITILGKGQTDQTGAYSLSVINPAFVQMLQVGSSSFPNFYGTSYSLSSFTGAWHYIVGTWDGSAWRLYVDGSNVATTANSQGPVSNGEPFVIGGRDSNGGISNLMNGALDEVRVSNAARTASWITTEYRNQSNPAQFYSVGSAH